MKLALIGGGGIRAPEFVRGALVFAAQLDLQELWLMDLEAERLALIGPLCETIVRRAGSPFRLYQTTDLDAALRDASMIVTTIRVGFEQGRVLDEQIALRLGVLGQETTGPGGMGMALRSIPALVEIASRAEALAPKAWTFNFTNPAGLVTQALHDSGFRRIVGICDSANTAQHAVAHWLGLEAAAVKTEVFGLNHLSWARRAWVKGKDVLPDLLADPAFINGTHLRFFGPEVVQRLGMFLNEYLYYFYFRDEALARIGAEEQTRGQEIMALNADLFAGLRELTPEAALDAYDAYNRRRNASYMAYAEPDPATRHQAGLGNREPANAALDSVDGYAGVALRTGLALLQDQPLRIALNVPNEGTIAGMQPGDVVEVTCEVDGRGIRPVFIGAVPEGPYLLMRAVKQYERLLVEAIRRCDRALAVEALVAHPLVGSYAIAHKLVDQYLEAHRAYVGVWA